MIDPRSILLHPALVGLFGLLLTGLGALIGYAIRYQLDKRKELVSEVNRERRAVYQQIVEFLFGILQDTKQGKPKIAQVFPRLEFARGDLCGGCLSASHRRASRSL